MAERGVSMDDPRTVIAECPNCGETPHSIVRGRSGVSRRTLDAVVRCTECEQVHHVSIAEKKDMKVRFVISDGRVSTKEMVELHPDDVVSAGDELFAGREYVQIRSIEAGDRRVERAVVSDIDTIWARVFDKVKVKISIHRGSTSVSRYVLAPPDEEFGVGDVISLDGMSAAVEKIKTEDGRSPRRAHARDIVRLYGKPVR
jgi:uncharacterized Zn finger protein